jgi:hypothetical protein
VHLVFPYPEANRIFLSPDSGTAPTLTEEPEPMVHELIFALVFLAIIAAPAVITIPSDKDERDSL